MSCAIKVLVVLIIIIVNGCSGKTERDNRTSTTKLKIAEDGKPIRMETADVTKAILLSLLELGNRVEMPSEYKLIRAEQLFMNGNNCWRITFKPVALLPADSSNDIIGLGGEIFINLDLNTNDVSVQYGE